MEAQTIQTILLIILAVGFSIMLLLGIIMAFIFVKIMTNIKHITQRADETSANLGQTLGYLSRKVAPAAFSALFAVLLRGAKSKIRRK